MNITKVLLTETISSLGHIGEVVNVANGYARNYLFPGGLAVTPTEHNIARYAKAKLAHEVEIEEREAKAIRLSNALSGCHFIFTRKAHDNNQLYGSVRAEEIVSKIEEELGEHIEASRVLLERPIDSLGPHMVPISLYKDISVELRIRVDREEVGED